MHVSVDLTPRKLLMPDELDNGCCRQALDLLLYKPDRYTKIPDMHELDLISEDDLVKISFINREDIWYAVSVSCAFHFPTQ